MVGEVPGVAPAPEVLGDHTAGVERGSCGGDAPNGRHAPAARGAIDPADQQDECREDQCQHSGIIFQIPATSDHDRDRLETALLREALDRDLPVLAICRGLQLLNVALGGTLVQHIEGHKCPGQREVHSITVAANSKLRSILGVDEYVVNSRHHQCVDKLVNGLVVTARAGSAPEAARSFAEFVEWTADAHLRHSRFMGLRDDKNPTDVRRE